MTSPTRRDLMGIAAGGLILPARAWAAARDLPTTPVIAPFTREKADVRDARFGQGTGPDGRAILPLAPSGRRIWLDTSSSGRGDGRSPESAFVTEMQAYGVMRGGDQLMIASGSTLTMPVDRFVTLSGRDAAFPTVIQSYDRAAPQDEARYGLLANRVIYKGADEFVGHVLKRKMEFVALRGITFDHSASEGRSEYHFNAGIDGLLIEQCAFLAAQLSLNSNDGTQGHVIRQTAFQGQWAAKGHSQGIYTSGNFDTVIEDCIFHHCGWRMSVDRTATPPEGGPTIFNHCIYAAVQSGGIVRRCVFVESSSHGAQLRGNWHSHDNVYVACPIALLHGGGVEYAIHAPDGVMALAYRNIITIAQPIRPTLPRGIGVGVANTREGSIVAQTLLVGPGVERAGPALQASAQDGPGYAPNPTRIIFAENTNAWSDAGFERGKGKNADATPDRVFVTARDNIIRADRVGFVDPSRDGLSAARSFDCRTVRDFGNAMIADPTRPWALRIADHIRPGFAPRGARLAAARGTKGAVLPDGSWNDG